MSEHRDLSKNLLEGTSFIPGDDGTGKTDQQGHGTAMAGLIAANSDTSSGLRGIAPEARILPIRISGPSEIASAEDAAKGIAWAVENGASVINVSMAGGPNTAVRKAVENAISRNIIIVASSGNKPQDSIIQFPAYIDGVIAVGAVDTQGLIAKESVAGDKLQLAAPGTNIVSTGLNNESRLGTGTSPSAAIVSGVAALVWSRYPELSAVEVVHRMTATAVDKGAPGRDPEYGFGIVDPVAALTADVPPLAASAGPSPSSTSEPATEPNTMGQVAVVLVAVIASLAGVGLVIALLIFRLRGRRNDAGFQGDGTDNSDRNLDRDGDSHRDGSSRNRDA